MPVLPDHEIQALITAGAIKLVQPESVQPSSLDLTIGSALGQLTAKPSPRGTYVVGDLERLTSNYLPNITGEGWAISPGQVWYSTGVTSLALPDGVWGAIDPKSSMGRIDLSVQSIVPGGKRIGEVPAGFRGKVTHLLTSQSFHAVLPPNLPVAQLRLYRGERAVVRQQTVHLSLRNHVVAQPTGKPLIIQSGANSAREFFRAKHVYQHEGARRIILEPGQFLLATTIEGVAVPLDQCAELTAVDLGNGHLIIHYAGFIDPGFGLGHARGNVIVLEIRNMGTTPIELVHGMGIGTLTYEQLTSPAAMPYGKRKNHYGHQRKLQMAKFFV